MARLELVILPCLLLILSLAYGEEYEVRQLNVISRHGDRTPEIFPDRFPNDPNMFRSYYPLSSGDLIMEGKMRMYSLGKWLRNRYFKFLGNDYHEKRVFGISSNLSRTKMSLQLILSALYPPSLSSQKWNDRLDWQPIPTFYNEFNRDILFNRDRCDLYLKELARVKNLTEAQAKLHSFDDYLEDLRKVVGREKPLSLDDILLLHNNLDIEQRMNLTMEPWMLSVLNDKNLTDMRMLYYELSTYNYDLKRYQAGGLLRNITEDMLKCSNGSKDHEEKISLYSGHDKNLIALMAALNITDLHFPEFGSALVFELLSKNENYYVKILYYLGIPADLKVLKLPGCDEICPLKRFVSLTKYMQATDKEYNCKIPSSTYFE